MFLVYIIESLKDGSFYIGQTKNINDRLKRHNEGKNKFTKSRKPWKLVYKEKFQTRSEAMKREKEIKSKKKRKYVEDLINNGPAE